jgi:uncharacterized membrane protein YgdD (TMEM256/DUF423 family)
MIRKKKLAITGALLITVSIVLGAFGAHALRDVLSTNQLNSFKTATDYLAFHGLAFIVLSLIRAEIDAAAKMLFYGLMIFSGSIYTLTFMAYAKVAIPSGLGLITPVGGVLLIIGWVWTTWAISQAKEHKGSIQ